MVELLLSTTYFDFYIYTNIGPWSLIFLVQYEEQKIQF